MKDSKVDIDSLIDEVTQHRGCKVLYITDPNAKEFVDRITEMKQAGKEPNLERSSEILEDKWGIEIKRRALSEHTRGKCSCPKKKQ